MSIAMTLAQELLACLATSMSEAGGHPHPPASVCLRAGERVNPSLGSNTDECCSGLAWVRIARVENIRLGDDVARSCISSQRRLTLELGAARCLPWGTVQAPPTCDQWTDVALLADADYTAMEQALCCFYADARANGGHVVSFNDYEQTGPDGNCVGGVMTIQLETDCGCSVVQG